MLVPTWLKIFKISHRNFYSALFAIVASLTLAAPHTSAQTTVLTASPASIAPGDTVTVSWSGVSNPSSTDWIGLYSPGSSNQTFLAWIYASCSQAPGIAASSGSCPWAIHPRLVPGVYEMRLFAQDRFNLLAISNAFTVTGSSAGSLQVSSGSYSVVENGGSATVTITRTGGSAGVVGVSFATSNGTASAGSDYIATTQTVTFADGDTANKAVTIPILDDTLFEGNETVNLTLSNPTGGATLGSPSTAVLTIIDNEAVPPPPPSTTNLVGYWKFDEGSGTTAADASGNGYSGILSKASWTTGITGTALAPGGSATVSRNAAFEASQFTFSLWVKSASTPNPYEGIAGKTSSGNWNDGYGFYYASSSEIRFFVNAWNGNFARASINPTAWNHVVGTYDGTKVHIYVNSVEGTLANFTGTVIHGGSLIIGGLPGAGNLRNTFDEVRFYNRALSASEVQSLYNGSPTPADTVPPLRSNGAPSGTLASGTTQVTLSLTTDENATCKYGFTLGTNYGSLPNVFSTTGGTSHSSNLSGLQSGQSYNSYVRCQDTSGNFNTDDFVISFSVAAPSPPPVDTTPPSTGGLKARWKFDEGTGNLASDSSGNNNTAVLSNGPVWTTGKVGGALLFDGLDDYALVDNPTGGMWSGDYTVALWVKASSLGQSQYRSVFANYQNFGFGGTKDSFQIDVDGANPGNYRLYTLSAYPIAAVTTQWQFIAVTLNGTTLKTYNNGVLTNTYSLAVGESNTFRDYLTGMNRFGNGPFAGTLDEVRVYNRALSQQEIQAAYAAENATNPPPGDVTPPIISAVNGSAITSSGILISWLTDEPANTQVEYGTSTAYGQRTPLNTVLVTAHQQQLSGLTENTTYHYRVVSSDASGNLAVSQDFTFRTAAASGTPSPMGPLTVDPVNPRYFRDGAGNTVFLTGLSDGWELQDFAWTESTGWAAFDYSGYLDFFQSHNLNLIRMWSVEHTKVKDTDMVLTSPMPFVRTGPGNATDGLPKFDLTQLNQEYFDRLRSRVMAARDRNIYVMIMLFEELTLSWNWNVHNIANNINGINDTHNLNLPALTSIEEAYVRKVIDSVNDLDNVIYEVCNECFLPQKDWQIFIANYIKSYEATKPKQHPVNISYFGNGGPGTMDILFNSPADIVSAGNDGTTFDYEGNPPASDGRKVVLGDSDHFNGDGLRDPFWPWKSLTRGLYTMYMDRFTVERSDPQREQVRVALGQAKSYADKMDLRHMTPRNDLCSTQFCLANPGREYLVYLPQTNSVAVNLTTAPGNYNVEWFNPATNETRPAGIITGGTTFTATSPFTSQDSVLYLRATP